MQNFFYTGSNYRCFKMTGSFHLFSLWQFVWSLKLIVWMFKYSFETANEAELSLKPLQKNKIVAK